MSFIVVILPIVQMNEWIYLFTCARIGLCVCVCACVFLRVRVFLYFTWFNSRNFTVALLESENNENDSEARIPVLAFFFFYATFNSNCQLNEWVCLFIILCLRLLLCYYVLISLNKYFELNHSWELSPNKSIIVTWKFNRCVVFLKLNRYITEFLWQRVFRTKELSPFFFYFPVCL